MSEPMKTPEQYFLQQNFLSEGDSELTAAEQAFLRKYAGIGALEQSPAQHPESVMTMGHVPAGDVVDSEASGARDSAPDVSSSTATVERDLLGPSVQDQLRSAEEAQLVSFFLSGQEYALPISMVQEVIAFMEPTKLPAAPRFIAGIINLRGRVTPLVCLDELLGLSAREEDKPRFIVVCRHEELQIGLIIHAVATMYRVRGEEVEWNIESRLGVGSQHLAGLLKFQDRLIGIIAVDQLVRTVLER